MSTEQRAIYGLDPSKYPARIGQPWKDEEVEKLLRNIQKKKTMEEIAKEHQRTVGGIYSRIREIAADYHFNDNRPIEEIQKYTGLTKEEIEDAIKRRKFNEALKKPHVSLQPKPVIEKPKEEEMPTMKEVVSLLRDIQGKLNLLLERD
jgi:hypothetical protein